MLKWLKAIALLIILGILIAGLGAYLLYRYYEPELPDINSLKQVEYKLPLRVYTQDGKLLSQFGDQKRVPVSLDDTPENLINAFLAAEDDRFYEHPGVDYQGLLRAVIVYLKTGQKKQGGSTITMQVARNYLLSSERTFERKLKEIILSLKIDKQFSKQEILELYLNKIYLGHHAYGIGAASYIYFGKKVADLSLDEVAILAGLPKAPSTDNPVTSPERAKRRRDYVLRRMLELGYINQQQHQHASEQPVISKVHNEQIQTLAPYVAEMVRQFMVDWYGEDAYSKGFQVYTTINSKQQSQIENSLRNALHAYTQRHGYFGSIAKIVDFQENDTAQWDLVLANHQSTGDTVPAVVTAVKKQSIVVYTGNNQYKTISWKGLAWALPYLAQGRTGKKPTRANQITTPGDIIRIRKDDAGLWKLAQIPKVEGAMVALNPIDGAITALQGGFDFTKSKFNRVTQTQRQPGSGFKPIVYTTALEKGFTAASIINDAPIVFDAAQNGDEWRPENFSHKFSGPTRLRVGLRTSRNLVSIRLMREIGIDTVRNTAIRFGFPEQQLPKSLTLALGSGTASPLQMARTFATFANGGYRIDPYFIQRIESADGKELFRAKPKTACAQCSNPAPVIIDPDVHYIMHSMLQDVVRRGTARRAKALGRSDLAGKTGTTNDQRDAWFNGFSPTMVATAWVGFDSSIPLGSRETGSLAALPMWISFMKQALKNIPEKHFEQPENIVQVQIDPTTGLLAPANASNAITEIFRNQYAPSEYATPSSKNTANPEDSNNEVESLF
ncbi:MAG TPA: penicillin-binding protein 1A [Crenotrichaceae bacterium]|nr:penicillin-binding protein 1A [Crenotrichaceae bacterium]